MSKGATLLIADAGPVIALLGIQQLGLLSQLFDRVVLTATVRAEILHPLPSFMEVVPDPKDTSTHTWGRVIDIGEQTAIALAIEHPKAELLIDDLAGRREAASRGILLLGTLGLLRRAKLRGLLTKVRPSTDGLIGNGLWISPILYEQFLKSCSE